MISVIIPVYNVEKYIRKCLKSVLNQTFQDFEIIIIDDGSTDKSGIICDDFARHYGNIKVVHKRNGGVSSSRNKGLEESTGDMIVFVDSDDWIDKFYLEILYQMMLETQADLVISSAINVLEGKRVAARISGDKDALKAEIISKCEAYKRIFLCEHNVSVVAWAKMYRRRIFSKIKYPDGELCEDSKVISNIIEECDRIVCTNYVGYFHLRRKGSLMHRGMLSDYKVGVRNAQHLWMYIKEHYPYIEDAAKIFYYNNCIQLINYIVADSEKKYIQDGQVLRQEIIADWCFLVFSRYTKLIEKGAVISLMIGLSFYGKIWRIYLHITGKHAGTEI